jgi:16S rRNA (adenine1518-N6/adenine1519-N6)-dimethyltransferase
MRDDEPLDQVPGKRQTQSFLRGLFDERGLRPKSKLGQNFLIDLNLVDFILRNAELTDADLAVEVGSGTGSLTAQLAGLARAVLSVEIDSSFHQLARETLGDRPNVHLFHGDILRNKNHLNPEVLALLERLRAEHRPERIKLVANLPYSVATPVITNFLLSDIPFERMVVTVQWEIAERLIAEPSTKDYGALAVMVQSLADVELLRKLPPTVFWPRPQVASAIVRIRPNEEKRAQLPSVGRFRVFLRDLYSHRRKNLRGALAAMPGWSSKQEVDARLGRLGIDGNLRAEALDVQTHHRLAEAFAVPLPDDDGSRTLLGCASRVDIVAAAPGAGSEKNHTPPRMPFSAG